MNKILQPWENVLLHATVFRTLTQLCFVTWPLILRWLLMTAHLFFCKLILSLCHLLLLPCRLVLNIFATEVTYIFANKLDTPPHTTLGLSDLETSIFTAYLYILCMLLRSVILFYFKSHVFCFHGNCSLVSLKWGREGFKVRIERIFLVKSDCRFQCVGSCSLLEVKSFFLAPRDRTVFVSSSNNSHLKHCNNTLNQFL